MSAETSSEAKQRAHFLEIRTNAVKKLRSTEKNKSPIETVNESIKAGTWRQEEGNWILDCDDLFVCDENGHNLPYQIALCGDTLPYQNQYLVQRLVNIALGSNSESTFLDSGTRSWAGVVNLNTFPWAYVYMNDIDISGVERLKHMNLLSIALEDHHLYKVPKPIFATTNFLVLPFIQGSIARYAVRNEMVEKLGKIRHSLIESGMWDKTIKIDCGVANFRMKKNFLYNFDPVFRKEKHG